MSIDIKKMPPSDTSEDMFVSNLLTQLLNMEEDTASMDAFDFISELVCTPTNFGCCYELI